MGQPLGPIVMAMPLNIRAEKVDLTQIKIYFKCLFTSIFYILMSLFFIH